MFTIRQCESVPVRARVALFAHVRVLLANDTGTTDAVPIEILVARKAVVGGALPVWTFEAGPGVVGIDLRRTLDAFGLAFHEAKHFGDATEGPSLVEEEYILALHRGHAVIFHRVNFASFHKNGPFQLWRNQCDDSARVTIGKGAYKALATV